MAGHTLVIAGSGPGIGVTTASLFASKRFDSIALLSRNPERLKSDAETVRKASGNAKVSTYPVDFSDHAALQKALEQVAKDLGPPEVVLFNAARIEESKIGDLSPERLLQDFQLMGLGIYVVACWAKPYLEARAGDGSSKPCFFLSGGAVHQDPVPDVFALCMQKAAQLNFLKSFDKVVGPRGVHVGHVNIGGAVKDDEPELNAKNISSKYWELYNEDKSKWRFNVDVGVSTP